MHNYGMRFRENAIVYRQIKDWLLYVYLLENLVLWYFLIMMNNWTISLC